MSKLIVVSARTASPAARPGARVREWSRFTTLAWVTCTPLGRPVDPEVKMTYAHASPQASCSMAGSGGGLPRPTRCSRFKRGTCARPWAVTWFPPADTSSSSLSAARASSSRSNTAESSVDRDHVQPHPRVGGVHRHVAGPRPHHPEQRGEQVRVRSMHTPTRSPDPIPRWRNSWAIHPERRASSAYVTPTPSARLRCSRGSGLQRRGPGHAWWRQPPGDSCADTLVGGDSPAPHAVRPSLFTCPSRNGRLRLSLG